MILLGLVILQVFPRILRRERIISHLSKWQAAAAKSLQLCPTLCDLHKWQPTRLPHPWDSLGKNTGTDCISFSNA